MWKRPYNETLPRTPENLAQAAKWAEEKRKAMASPAEPDPVEEETVTEDDEPAE